MYGSFVSTPTLVIDVIGTSLDDKFRCMIDKSSVHQVMGVIRRATTRRRFNIGTVHHLRHPSAPNLNSDIKLSFDGVALRWTEERDTFRRLPKMELVTTVTPSFGHPPVSVLPRSGFTSGDP